MIYDACNMILVLFFGIKFATLLRAVFLKLSYI